MNEIIINLCTDKIHKRIGTLVIKSNRESVIINQNIEQIEVVLLKEEAVRLANAILKSYK